VPAFTILQFVAAAGLIWLLGGAVGSLLIAPTHTRQDGALAVLRVFVGLLAASVALLLALALSLPRFSLVGVLVLVAVLRHGWHLVAALRPRQPASAHEAVAVLLAGVMLLPPLVSSMLMAPGPFPPVFFNVDMPYFLEKVHAVMAADAFPPPSLGVAGGSRPYHFGLHAAVALVAGLTGALPHQVLFGLFVPLVLIAILAGAMALARSLASSVPAVLSVPLLIAPVPTLWYDFSRDVTPRVSEALGSGTPDPVLALTTNWEMWGATPNVQNMAAYALTLAFMVGMARAATIGWALAVFAAGSTFLFKSPAGVALMAAFGLIQAARVATDRSLKPLQPLAAAGLVFLGIYGAFWLMVPGPGDLRASFTPLFHLDYLDGHGGRGWFVLDVLLLVLPACAALILAPRGQTREGLLLLVCACGPLIAVNTLRLVDLRKDFGISSMNEDDWRQVIMPVPLLLHAAALAIVGSRWHRLGMLPRIAVAATMVVSVAPAAFVAARYTTVLVETPTRGHEYADNRAIGEALVTIPVAGSLVVTNDLRYPADDFERDRRQMQVPALFGHQAFAVNYFYEAYPFSRERARLQALLEGESWSTDIDDAARTHGWTHLLIRNDYPHPVPVPLQKTFDNGTYAVYRFETTGAQRR